LSLESRFDLAYSAADALALGQQFVGFSPTLEYYRRAPHPTWIRRMPSQITLCAFGEY